MLKFDSAFQNCYKLPSVTIQTKVQKIGKQAFYNCENLKKITIKSKALTGIGKNAFKRCKKNIVIKVPSEKASAYRKLIKGKY